MKKVLVILAVVMLASCTKENNAPQQQISTTSTEKATVVSPMYEMIEIEKDCLPSIYPPTGDVKDVCTYVTGLYQFRVDLAVHKIAGHPTVLAVYTAVGDTLRQAGSIEKAGQQRWKMGWSHNGDDTPEHNVCFKLVADGTYGNDYKDGKVIDSIWYRCCDKCTFKN